MLITETNRSIPEGVYANARAQRIKDLHKVLILCQVLRKAAIDTVEPGQVFCDPVNEVVKSIEKSSADAKAELDKAITDHVRECVHQYKSGLLSNIELVNALQWDVVCDNLS